MADQVKKVTSTPPPPQLSTDDNRRRTRSQTKNGGVTSPAPVPEPRGRKRASSGTPGTAKRGRKSAQSSASTEVVDPTASDVSIKEHSKPDENRDLSTQLTSEPANKESSKKDQDIQMEVEENKVAKEIKTPEKQPEASKKASGEALADDSCKLIKPSKSVVVKEQPAQPAAKSESKVSKETRNEPEVPAPNDSHSLAKKMASPKAPEKIDNVSEVVSSKDLTAEAVKAQIQEGLPVEKKDEVVINNTTKASHPADSEQTKPSEPKIDSQDEKHKSDAGVDVNDEKEVEEQQIKVQESGDGKLEPAANKDEACKAEDTKVNDQTNSATPV